MWDWGNVPSWIASIIALVALVLATFTFFRQRRSELAQASALQTQLANQLEQLENARRTLRDATMNRLREPAGKVSVWLEEQATFDYPGPGFVIRPQNLGDGPVYDLELFVENEGPVPRGGKNAVFSMTIPLLPPKMDQPLEEPTLYQLGIPYRDPSDQGVRRAVRFRFRDALGHSWERTPEGKLNHLRSPD